jgi:hypothetical protein
MSNFLTPLITKKYEPEKIKIFCRFKECRYYILLSNDLNYSNEQTKIELTVLIEEGSRLLNGYCKGFLSATNNSLTSNNSSNS